MDSHALLPVHAILKVWFKGSRPEVWYDAVKLPDRLFNLFNEVCIRCYAQENIDRAELKRSAMQISKDKGSIDVKVDLPPVDFPPKYLAT